MSKSRVVRKKKKSKQVVYAENQVAMGFKTVRLWLPAHAVEEYKDMAVKTRDDYLESPEGQAALDAAGYETQA